MAGTHVVLRLPSQGTLFGDALAQHSGSRITSVPTARRDGATGSMVDLLALVEGLPDEALGALLLAWNRRYGEPVQVLGESFALRLPLKVDMVRHPASDILQMDERLPVIGNVAQGDWMEQWLGCASAAEAEALADRLRKALGAASGVVVRTAEPRPQDADCWEVLRFAGGLESPVAA